jgi:asparagine N-glycosylation enzyme membrane subunit Stt3
MKFHRSWLLAIPAFAATYRIGLHFYFAADCIELQRNHPELTNACAFGNGSLDGRAIIATLGPALVLLLLCFFTRAPRAWLTFLLGAVAAFLAFSVQAAWGEQLQIHFGTFFSLHGINLLAMALAAIVGILLLGKRVM